METTIYCPDIECSSCVKVITRALQAKSGVQGFSINKDCVTIAYDPAKATREQLAELVREKGFRAGFEPFSRKTFAERWRDFRESKEKYSVEYQMLEYSAYTLGLLFIVEFILFWGLFNASLDFLAAYGWWFLYLTISIVALGAAMWHLHSYEGNLTTMTGMMIGMTFGMQTGFLIGTILGATNGMFVGSMAGMLSGVIVGWCNGLRSGIMGIMEGTMAGIMAGLMGAMTGVMLLVDNILWFMPFFVLLNLLVILGLSYMLFEEFVEGNKTISKQPISFSTYFSFSFLALALLGFIMLYGPKSGITELL
jgi:copper chaperone CopZ